MLRQLNTRRGGFTLVEIMIVVAIIALLATMAVPQFLRSRKRSQASTILEDVRIIDHAKDQYAIDYNLKGTDSIEWTNLRKYIKPSAGVYVRNASEPQDLFNTKIDLNNVDEPPTIQDSTYNAFTDVDIDAKFWGAYYKAAPTIP